MSDTAPALPWRRELSRLVRLATPVVVVQLGLMTMGVVDAAIVGHASATALAAVALGHLYVSWLLGVGMGVLLALDPLVAQAAGADDDDAVARHLQRGLVLAALLSVPVSALLLAAEPLLHALEQPPEIIPLAGGYARACVPAVPAFLAFVVLRQGLQALHAVAPLVVAVVFANLANVVLDWALVFGELGFPELGAIGSGWATSATRWLMVLTLAVVAWPELRRRLGRWQRRALQPGPLVRLLRLGAPIGLQHGLEMGTFSAIAIFMGWFGPGEVAANHVALSLVSTTFMIPLGLSAAAAVRVGHAVGRGDAPGARAASIASLGSGAVVMAVSASVLLAVPETLARAFTPDPAVVTTAAALLRVAGIFQLFDGLQVVAVGVLRGLGDTRSPVVVNVAGFVLLALPLALWLGFRTRLGPVGLWWGLAAGLAAVALVLLIGIHRELGRELRRLDIEDELPRPEPAR